MIKSGWNPGNICLGSSQSWAGCVCVLQWDSQKHSESHSFLTSAKSDLTVLSSHDFKELTKLEIMSAWLKIKLYKASRRVINYNITEHSLFNTSIWKSEIKPFWSYSFMVLSYLSWFAYSSFSGQLVFLIFYPFLKGIFWNPYLQKHQHLQKAGIQHYTHCTWS